MNLDTTYNEDGRREERDRLAHEQMIARASRRSPLNPTWDTSPDCDRIQIIPMASRRERTEHMKARYEIVERQSDSHTLIISEAGAPFGPDNPFPARMTITNDVEAVVADLHRRGLLPPGRRLLYYDTVGDLDEIVHSGSGEFVRFAPLRQARTRRGEES